jgi:hypothetical protein
LYNYCTRLLYILLKIMHRKAPSGLLLVQRCSSGIVLVCPTKANKRRPIITVSYRREISTSSARPPCCRPRGYQRSRQRSSGRRSQCYLHCWHRWRRSWLRYRRRRRSPALLCQYFETLLWSVGGCWYCLQSRLCRHAQRG